ncbi:cutinase family protein [Kribbella sp. NBC_01505]|uniref:cutinase family protein n=1 Tax=Kribbella sp. NBC_01505 TaxID=2903580 RepID=UPI003870BC61
MSAMLLVFGGLVFAPARSQAAPAPPPCTGYLVVHARGSGEVYGSNTTLQYAQAAKRSLSPSSIYEVDYPAAPPVNRDIPWANWYEFKSSVALGVDRLRGFLEQRVVTCPNEQIGLIGYSQGAMVVHEAVSELSDAATARIGAVLVFGNPFSWGPSWYNTTLDPRTGQLVPEHGKGLLMSDEEFSRPLQTRTIELCLKGDKYCDAPRSFFEPPWETVGDVLNDAHVDELVGLLNNPIHGQYRTAAGAIPLVYQYGTAFAKMLLAQPCGAKNTRPMPIPDANDAGPVTRESTNEVFKCTRPAALKTTKVGVSIVHPFIGDLRIVLRGPDGVRKTLKEPDDSDGRIRLDTTFEVDASSMPAAGIWALEITDTSVLDSGTLMNWWVRP